MLSKRGAFILFEGCDRSGKSTQSRKLAEALQNAGIPVKSFGFPDRSTSIGQLIDGYLKKAKNLPDEAIHLLFSTNRWECQRELKEHLDAGTTIVVDRYAYSGVAYTVAKGLDFDWCLNPDKGLIKPDAVIYLKTDIDELTTRSDFGEERYEKAEFQGKVSAVFDRIYSLNPTTWHLLKANEPIDNIHEAIKKIALDVIDDVKGKPLNQIE